VLVMTSNIDPGVGDLRDVLRAHFKPEFINRLDDIVLGYLAAGRRPEAAA